MTRVIAIDPGMESGVFVGGFGDTSPLTAFDYFQVPGGLAGLDRELLHRNLDIVDDDHVLVFERFTPRPMSRQYRRDELEPLVIEGYIYATYSEDEIVYQRPASMLINGGSGAEGKKKADRLLRNLGLYRTGKDVGRPDANDVNAATKHALAYMVSIGHKPTIELMDANRD